jgi:hypothetical protein
MANPTPSEADASRPDDRAYVPEGNQSAGGAVREPGGGGETKHDPGSGIFGVGNLTSQDAPGGTPDNPNTGSAGIGGTGEGGTEGFRRSNAGDPAAGGMSGAHGTAGAADTETGGAADLANAGGMPSNTATTADNESDMAKGWQAGDPQHDRLADQSRHNNAVLHDDDQPDQSAHQ